MKAEDIAQWVIDNRYPKNENDKVSDHELYHGIVERIAKGKNLAQPDVSGRNELLAFLKWFGKEYASSEVAVIGETTLIDEYEKSK